MTTTTSQFSFTFLREKYTADFDVMKIDKVPQYRVELYKKGKERPEIFIFYEVKKPDQRFEWYKRGDIKNDLQGAIAKALTKHLSK